MGDAVVDVVDTELEFEDVVEEVEEEEVEEVSALQMGSSVEIRCSDSPCSNAFSVSVLKSTCTAEGILKNTGN